MFTTCHLDNRHINFRYNLIFIPVLFTFYIFHAPKMFPYLPAGIQFVLIINFALNMVYIHFVRLHIFMYKISPIGIYKVSSTMGSWGILPLLYKFFGWCTLGCCFWKH